MSLVLVVCATIIACTNALQACTSSTLTSAFSGISASSLYCCGALGGSPCFSSSSYSCPTTESISGYVWENYTLALSCTKPGFAISDITFASYGTPTQTTLGSCHATTSVSVVKKYCLSKSSCSISAINDEFGDPCVGTGKHLAVIAKCAAFTSTGFSSGCTGSCGLTSSDIFRSSSSAFTSTAISCLKSYSSCTDFVSNVQHALENISPACYLQQTSTSSISTIDVSSYTTSQFLNFLQGWSSFSSITTTSTPNSESSSAKQTPNSGTNTTPSPVGSASTQSSESSSSTTTIIIIVAVVVIAILLAILVFCYCRKKKSTTNDVVEENQFDEYHTVYNLSQQTGRNNAHMQEQSPQFNNYVPPMTEQPAPWHPEQYKAVGERATNSTDRSLGTGTLTNGSTNSQRAIRRNPDPNYSKINMHDLEIHFIPPDHLYSISVIARGAYGEVLLGDYQGQTVAIKKLLGHRKDLPQLQKFIDEISLVAKLNSQYIVQFKGASWTTPADIVLVTEFMDAGDLRSVLQNNSDKSFIWTHKVQCALDIASALGYLHTLHTKIVHRDLKSRNVLLNSRMQSKVTDFGVSRETDDATMTAGIGTFRWMAPEALLDNHYTESADMFSFGVILAELSNEIVPYSDKKNASGRPYTDTAIMTQVMKGELLPNFADDTPRWFYELGLKCLSLKPEDRPTALEAAHTIKQRI